ncbi:MAG TPA: hypothetical protein VMC79_14885 [Rectinemataceae bacterium]|nr:hypothetical protein [Rectinemataceae bacterium]
MDNLLQKAADAVDSNHLAEAIRSYVAVLAIYDNTPGDQPKLRADKASSELAKIGGMLSLEPGSDWVDSSGSQTTASTRTVGKPEGRVPSVYLFENFGTGKSPVADAPIYFQFVKNTGSLVSIVSTDAFGKANTNLASLQEPGSAAVIRAYPLFTVRGKTYAFTGAFRDFSYLPPANVARVFALASSELGLSDNPQILDSTVTALAPSGLQLAPFNGKLAAESFKRAFGGDSRALATLGIGADTPYAAFVLVEVQPARQMELNGVKYNIFTASADITFRLVRSDGTAVLAIPLHPVKGQGGTKEAAVADAYRRAAAALTPALDDHMDELKTDLQLK